MNFVIFIAYIGYSIYDIKNFKKDGLKREVWVYVSIMCLCFLVSGLIILGVHIPDPSIYVGKFLDSIQEFIGVKL